jgi:hypothetical protein
MWLENETLRDTLFWASEFHQELGERFQRSGQATADDRSAMLLDYLANHEARIANIVAAFEREGDLKSLNTWCVEYFQDTPMTDDKYSNISLDELGEEQILEFVVFKHSQILELFKNLLARAVIPSMKQLLTELVEVEEHEIKTMVQGANRMNEM